jgi:acetoin utilization deacetylase AcuC-like enzyme
VRLLAGDAPFAFSVHRPPGHHAETDRAMGFCLFNNVAVAAAHARAACGVERVMVVDWDVHHGNGTEEIFRERDDVLFLSIHESPLYPGTGPADEFGAGAGEGTTINLPVPAGTGGEGFRTLIDNVAVPLAERFEPGLIIVSAGYDAHRADPLSTCRLSSDDYGLMTASLRELGDRLEAPLLVCLEGGYDPDALAESLLATIAALAERRPAEPLAPELAGPARERIARFDRWSGAFAAA